MDTGLNVEKEHLESGWPEELLADLGEASEVFFSHAVWETENEDVPVRTDLVVTNELANLELYRGEAVLEAGAGCPHGQHLALVVKV
jgi:hypothetical protein